MKKLKSIFILIMLLSANAFAMGGSESHGGDYREMQLLNIAWRIHHSIEDYQLKSKKLLIDTDVLKKKILSLKIVFLKDISLGEVPRGAVNTPAANLLRMTHTTAETILDEKDEWKSFQFLLHELLPIIGMLDNGYVLSAKIVGELKKYTSETTSFVRHVLFNESFDPSYGGISFQQAAELCEKHRQRFTQDYFYVSCVYHHKHWITWIYDDWNDYWNSNTQSAWGLKIIGEGHRSNWRLKVLHSSIESRFNLDGLYFESKLRALGHCYKYLLEGKKENFYTYYRASCKDFYDSHNKLYWYQIITLNPLL